ncbi:MAG: archaemetzincin family Zn-dependent metalloprotease [Fidelibacterota bacterium]|nr:MAG: archaemetzincin family Zn-dependent metalloprotease [Candidatus Neomarinimicrobiota bacterium]
MAAIYCVPLDGFPQEILRQVVPELSSIYSTPIRLLPEMQTAEKAYEPVRRQHSSTAILQLLKSMLPDGEDRILGVTTADLFIPILTFVFGEAQLNGPAAVVSGQRLQNEFYGLKANAAVYHERLLKECVHELGHTYGLRHCLSAGCVMQKSTYVENIDLKTAEFCSACGGFLQEHHRSSNMLREV